MKKPEPQLPKKEFEKYAFLPKSIRIGYQDIKILEVDAIDDTQGSYNNTDHEIKIRSGMKANERINTVIHECLHAIVYTYGLKKGFKGDDEEENLVNTLANGLTEVFVRNKELVEFIRQSV